MARSILEVVLQGVDKLSGPMRKAGESVKDFEKRTKSSKAGLKQMGAAAVKLTAALGATALVVAKVYEAMKEGAAVRQTADSFGFLMGKVGASTDTLDQLRAASKGTISDLDLMSSTATLLAGAQGSLATQLASSTPRLLEIAKAANKLNPALGDTTFLYNSLATGVKRASPMILDNLGLTIRIGAANEAYAEALGKTVEQLTADEQKQALLNETLRAGAVLVEQAGGNTDSATDSYARLGTEWANANNSGKAILHESLHPIVDVTGAMVGVYGDVVKGLENAVVAEAQLMSAVEEGIVTQAKANELINKATYTSFTFAEALSFVEKESANADIQLAAVSHTLDLFGQVGKLTEAGIKTLTAELETGLAVALGETTTELEKQKEELKNLTERYYNVDEAAGRSEEGAASLLLGITSLTEEIEREEAALKEAASATDGLAATVEDLTNELSNRLSVALGKTSQEIVDMQTAADALAADLKIVWDEAKAAEWVALSVEIDQVTRAFEDAARANKEWLVTVDAQTESADRAKRQMADLYDVVVEHEEITAASTDTTEQWSKIQGLAKLAAGDTTRAILAQEDEVARLTRLVEENDFQDQGLIRTWVAAQVQLGLLSDEFRENSGSVRDNTAALAENADRTERNQELKDQYALATGRASVATLALEHQIRAAEAAFLDEGAASGYSAAMIAGMKTQLDAMQGVLRDTAGNLDSATAAQLRLNAAMRAQTQGGGTVDIPEAAISALYGGKSIADMRVDLETASGGGGFWAARASDTEVMREYYKLRQSAKGEDVDWGAFYEQQPDLPVEDVSSETKASELMGAMGAGNVLQDWMLQHLDAAGASFQDILNAGYEMPADNPALEARAKEHLGQHGWQGIVPSGYPRDSFRFGATSGEHVQITPQHMLRGGGMGGAMVINTVNVYGVQTDSQLFTAVTRVARQRGRAFARVM